MRDTTVYNQAGTLTGRRASSGFYVDLLNKIKVGGNLQNKSKQARKMYFADGYHKGLYEKCCIYLQTRNLDIFTPEERAFLKIICQVDQSGAEALIVAYLCRKGNFRDLFLYKVKPHVFVALHLFSKIWQKKINEYSGDIKIDITEALTTPIPQLNQLPYWKQLDKLIKSSDYWTASERYYYIAKQVCHSSNYGIRPSAFQLNTIEKSEGEIVLTKKQAEEYLLFYHSLFPEIQEWHREVQAQLENTRIIYNLFGEPRIFTCEINEQMFKDAYAHAPQSTVAGITSRAYVKMQSFIEENAPRWDMLADGHDSIVSQCPIGDEIVCCKTMKGAIEQELISPRGEKFTMRSEAQYGFNWGPYKNKEPKNEIGLIDASV